jgi:D-3-phosphoglycerate dehydrogenase
VHILVAESNRFSSEALRILRELGEAQLADLDRNGLMEAVGEADVLWVRLRNQIDREIMDHAPRLKVIVSATTGLNHIDVEEAHRRGVQVLSLRGETDFLKDIRATAEHTVALALALIRHLPQAYEHVLSGGWNRDLFWGRELYGKTVGIFGYGRLGRLVGQYFHAFGMQIRAADPFTSPESMPPYVRLAPQDALLAHADLVSLHVSLDASMRGFFGREQFAKMKPGAWFINTARGELIDERALLDALTSGRLSAAAVDVLSGEHSSGMADHPLVLYARTHENLIITPHLGGCTCESVEKTETFLARALSDLLAKSPRYGAKPDWTTCSARSHS